MFPITFAHTHTHTHSPPPSHTLQDLDGDLDVVVGNSDGVFRVFYQGGSADGTFALAINPDPLDYTYFDRVTHAYTCRYSCTHRVELTRREFVCVLWIR